MHSNTSSHYKDEELYRIEKQIENLMTIQKYDKCHYTHRLVDTQ